VNERALQYWTNLRQYWNKFNKTYKLLIVGTIVLFVLAMGIIAYNNSKTEYSYAFTDLQPNDAASIKQYLDTAGIPYQLSADGKGIAVPTKQAASVRLDVTQQGLNKNGSIGLGVFREGNIMGTTENQFKMMKLEAVQGEIQSMLNANEAISGSKVLLNMPEKPIFTPKDKSVEAATASVVVNVKPGYTLDQQKIDTMYLLVSKSVPNLTVDNITISDQLGDLLPYSKSSNGIISAGGTVAEQLKIKKQFEQDLRKEVKEMLGGMLGANKVIPMVVATLNFDKKSTDSRTVTPVVGENGLPISTQETNKSSQSDSSSPAGVPGTGTTDVPTYPGGSNSGKATSEESSKIVNYEINRINQIVESQPFYVTDLTISVGIDGGGNVSQPMKDSIQKMLANVVSTSLANSGKTMTAEELNGKVTVFDQTFATGTSAAAGQGTNWYLYGGIGAAAVALAAAGGFVMASRRRKAAELAAMEADLPQAAAKVEFPTIDLDNLSNDSQARKQLEQLAKKKPEEFVNLLRTWLVDE